MYYLKVTPLLIKKVEMRRTLRRLLQLWAFIKVFQHDMCMSQYWISCNAYRSKCCNNNTKRVPQSSKTSDTNSSNLTATELKGKTEENHSLKCSSVPFSPHLLNVPSTPTRTNTVSPFSATEVESNDWSKLPGHNKEESSETANDFKNK